MVTCSGLLMTLPDKEVNINDIAYVYCLKFTNGMIYVGSTGEIEKRLARHSRDLKNKKHHCKPLQEAVNRGETYTIELHICRSRELAFEFEQKLITKYEKLGILLNIGRHSKGGDNLTRHPDRIKIIKKITESGKIHLNKLSIEERKVKYGNNGNLNGMFGRSHSSKTKMEISKANRGNKNRLGKKATEETKAKLSTIASKRLGKLNSFYGKKHSNETKRKIADLKRGFRPANTNKLEIDGVIYSSQTEAAKALGVAQATITHRIKSKNKKYSGYRVI